MVDRVVRAILDPKTGPWILLVGTALILLVCPAGSSLWTLEGRTGAICREMMRSGDYVHPYLFDDEYYDKPLLPYWMVIGVARVTGRLDETAMRLPGMLAGLVAVLATWRIGLRLFGPLVGITAGWLLTTCGMFAFWARVSGADILNVAAVTVALAWYVERRDRPGFAASAVFFAILAVGAQLKGLIAPAMVVLAIAPDLLRDGRWRSHARVSLIPAMVPALLLYLLPFTISSVTSDGSYRSDGLVMAFRENVVRYFRPFDHQSPVYEYALHLPAYLLPWTFFLPFVLWRARRWKDLEPNARRLLEAAGLILVFLTLSGSRRHYYMLPVLPILVLSVADWLHRDPARRMPRRIAFWTAGVFAVGLTAFFGLLLPSLGAKGGTRPMAAEVRRTAEREAPWSEWKVVLFNTKPQMGFYLDTPGRPRRLFTREELREELRGNPRSVVITTAREATTLELELGPCATVVERSTLPWSLGKVRTTATAQVAFIPVHRVARGQ